MKKILHYVFALALTALFGLSSIAQVTNEGTPLSWSQPSLKSLEAIQMPSFDLEAIQAEDEVNDGLRNKPWRFGHEFDVSFGLEDSGKWEKLENGDRIWRINIKSAGAQTLNFLFDEYHLPEGAKIYLYTEDRSDLLGAYTSKMNNDASTLGTWLVDGDNVWIEYFEPKEAKGLSKLHIGKVVHGYRSVRDNEMLMKGLNDSGACNLDVDCGVGDDFQDSADLLKHAVALMISGNSSFCTGTLINNTNNDQEPLFLTANHCGTNVSGWAFRFNWISPNPVCAQNTNSTNGSFNQTSSGAQLLATNSNSDFTLVRITGGLDEDWDLEWAGWDRTDDVPEYSVGIHHPSGDIMKICRDDSPMSKAPATIDGTTAQCWFVNEGSSGGWEQGVTERGSSGSALFDQEGRIIGQLFGGGAFCNGTNDNGRLDVYGRFAVSWDAGSTPSTRLSEWLDPAGTGQETLSTLSLALGLTDNLLDNSITVYPNPTDGELSIVNRSGKELVYSVLNVLGQEVKSGSMSGVLEMIQLGNNPTGIYFLNVENLDNGSKTTKKIILK